MVSRVPHSSSTQLRSTSVGPRTCCNDQSERCWHYHGNSWKVWPWKHSNGRQRHDTQGLPEKQLHLPNGLWLRGATWQTSPLRAKIDTRASFKGTFKWRGGGHVSKIIAWETLQCDITAPDKNITVKMTLNMSVICVNKVTAVKVKGKRSHKKEWCVFSI